MADRTALAPAPAACGAERRAVTSFHKSLVGFVRPPFFADLGRGGLGLGTGLVDGSADGTAVDGRDGAGFDVASVDGYSRDSLFNRRTADSDMGWKARPPGRGARPASPAMPCAERMVIE